ncbi:hypothetical protein [Lysobacter sp. CA199]|uniref:hypothetical protein n=1 Tax=Lysobacter sp. CA199 TaxID=3455608 RepID=UPI003F8D65A8
MKTVTASCIAVLLVLGGCATMEQAPLVYSSKTSVGVDISTTSTETPGLSMSVGVKLVDAAYVPVAVSKRCQTKDGGYECSPAINGVHIIGGTASGGGQDESVDADLKAQNYQKALQDFGAAVVGARDASADADDAREQYKRLESLSRRDSEYNARQADLIKLTALRPAASTAPPTGFDNAANEKKISDIERLALSAGEAADLAADPNLTNATRKRNETVAEQDRATDLLAKRRNELTAAREALALKKDSYSVFGSFENKNSADAKGASVSLGKIFATGVASQNISQGLAKYYQHRDSSACYQAVSEQAALINNADKVERLLQQCINLSKKGE